MRWRTPLSLFLELDFEWRRRDSLLFVNGFNGRLASWIKSRNSVC